LEARRLLTTVAALSTDNQLLIVDASDPRIVLNDQAITGLQPSELLMAIDARPGTGDLYGLSDGARLYTLNPTTGAATLKASLSADASDVTSPFTALVGTDFGTDFDPVTGRLRIVSDADQNLDVNPDTGKVITQTPIAYDAGDQSSAVDPLLVDIAYTNNFDGAITTTLLGMEGIDPALHDTKVLPDGTSVPALSLVRVGGADGTTSPDTGLLFTVGPFGRDGVQMRGMDIAADGTTYVGVRLQFSVTDVAYELVSINPNSGVDTAKGHIGNDTVAIEDIAVLPSVQFGAAVYAAVEGNTATITVQRPANVSGTLTVDVTAISGTAAAGADFTPTMQTLTFTANDTSKTFDVPITDDQVAEDDEFFVVSLSNPSTGTTLGARSSATVRISANDDLDDVGPQVREVLLTGPSRAISGAVIHFSEDMNTATAQNLANYTFTAKGKKSQTIQLSSGVYDAAARTVTLTATQSFMQTDFKELQIRIRGKGGVIDAAGNALDGKANGKRGSDATFRFNIFSGTSITITDRDGDKGPLTVANGGRLDGIAPIKGSRTQRTQFWILDPIALRSTLSGTVQKAPRGDGIVVIAEIIGL